MDIVKIMFNLSLNLVVISMKTFSFLKIFRGGPYMIYMVATGQLSESFPEFSLIKKIP